MIVDVHAHAVSERFLADLQRRPIAGISAERGDNGTYFMRGGGWDRPSSLDVNLHDLPRRLASLKRREVELQLFAPPPGFFSGPAGRPAANGSKRCTHKSSTLPRKRKA
jgi:aminocarboxymuconate-semialdehyde decarboxylase